jgi:hypothetical protein
MANFHRIKGSFYDATGRLQKHGTILLNLDYTDAETGEQWRAAREALTDDHFPVVMRCGDTLGSFIPASGEAERIGITIASSS